MDHFTVIGLLAVNHPLGCRLRTCSHAFARLNTAVQGLIVAHNLPSAENMQHVYETVFGDIEIGFLQLLLRL